MKKFLIYITVAASLVACNNDLETEGISRTTYFPEFVVEGEDLYIVDDAASYSEPGITVLEQGEPIDFTTTYTGRYTGYTGTTIGTADDQYTVTYDAVNRDGFAASTSRTVVVTPTGDFSTSIAGAYLAESVRISGEAYEDVLVMVIETAPGVFTVTDALGGFYSDGRGLGDDYLVPGLEITVNDLSTNDFTYTTDVERIADGAAMEVSELSIDTANKTITFRTTTGAFGNGDWEITLTQIQPE